MPDLHITDMASLDGGQTITITQAVTLIVQTVNNALKRGLSLREIELYAGTLAHGDAKFHFPAAGLTFAPKVDDVITAGGGWDIKAVDLLALGTRYCCWCKKQPGA